MKYFAKGSAAADDDYDFDDEVDNKDYDDHEILRIMWVSIWKVPFYLTT